MYAATEALLGVLRKNIPPLTAENRICVCSPAEPPDDCALGLFPYRTGKDPRFQIGGNIAVDADIMRRPPLCTEMFFMVTAYAGKKAGLTEDLKLLERVLRVFHDKSEIQLKSALQPSHVPYPRAELLSPDNDEISKIWQFPNSPYRLSLFYRLAPVAIASSVEITVNRVQNIG